MSRSRTATERLDIDPILTEIKETILSLSLRPEIEVYGFEIEMTGEPEDPYTWISLTHGPDERAHGDSTDSDPAPTRALPAPSFYETDWPGKGLHTEFSSQHDD